MGDDAVRFRGGGPPPAGVGDTLRRVALPACLVTLGVLPTFLVSSLAVFIRGELQFSEALLGVTLSASFTASALSSATAGRLTQRFGSRLGFGIGAALVGTALAVTGLVRTWAALTICLLVGGVGNAFIQVSANLRIARGVSPAEQGLAFGIKQSAIPFATLIAGSAVPLLGLSIGWRAAFLLAAAAVLTTAVIGQRVGPAPPVTTSTGRRARVTVPVLLLTVGVALAAGVGTTLGTFLVESAVSSGWRTGSAGALLAVASAACIATRLLLGRRLDRSGGDGLRLMARQLGVGAPAVFLLGSGVGGPMVLAAATLAAFVFGWGWSGAFNHAVVRRSGGAAAEVTGVTQVGVYTGAGMGPLVFGGLVTNVGYRAAWSTAAGGMLLAAVCIIAADQISWRRDELA